MVETHALMLNKAALLRMKIFENWWLTKMSVRLISKAMINKTTSTFMTQSSNLRIQSSRTHRKLTALTYPSIKMHTCLINNPKIQQHIPQCNKHRFKLQQLLLPIINKTKNSPIHHLYQMFKKYLFNIMPPSQPTSSLKFNNTHIQQL